MNKEKSLAVMPTEELAQRLQDVVLSVTGVEGLNGFKKAYMMAEGIQKLKELLTPCRPAARGVLFMVSPS